MFCKKRKGQSTLEYVILTGFVVAALIAMGTYMKRGVQGKLRESTNDIGEQYEAGKTTSHYKTTTYINQTQGMETGGKTTVKLNEYKVEKEQVGGAAGAEKVAAWENK